MQRSNSLIAAAALVTVATTAQASVLDDLAASLQPGAWAELPTTGLTEDLLSDVGGYHILQYTDNAVWDPAAKHFLFIGQGHSSNWDGDPTTGSRFIRFAEDTNDWAVLPRIPSGDVGHAYDHSAFNPATGMFYHRPFGARTVYQFDVTSQAWSALGDITDSAMPSTQCCGGLAYFPEMDSLIFVDGDWGIASYGLSSQEWTRLGDGNVDEGPLPDFPMGDYHGFAEYSPVHGVVVFGGGNGSSDLYVLDASGTITPKNPAPVGLGITQTIIVADPGSGNLLVAHESAVFYEYDVAADTWTTLSAEPPFFTENRDGPVVGTIAAPVSTSGVVMFLTWNFDSSKAHLYRHSPGSGTPVPPRDGGVGGSAGSTADGGAGTGGSGGSTPDGGAETGGIGGGSAGTAGGSGAPPTVVPSEDSEGCACRLGAPRTSPTLVPFAALAVAIAFSRRNPLLLGSTSTSAGEREEPTAKPLERLGSNPFS